MNLRKDHCIIDSRSSRAALGEERAFGGRERGVRRSRRPPRSSPSLARASPGSARSRPALARPREALAGGVGRIRPVPNSARNPFSFRPNETNLENRPCVVRRALSLLGRRSLPRLIKPRTTLNDGCLGSRIDEERSEPRYVV